ncbi:MAG: hypothetical protein M3016_08205, partial [Actinomycetota bacterium]|nr:hypothetical protein [Actinomycetota bacterium]
RGPLVALLLAMVVAAVVGAVVLSGGQSSQAPSRAGTVDHPAASAGSSASTASGSGSSSSTASTSAVAGKPAAAAARQPASAVESFYQQAAAHRYPQAWALAGPGLRAQLGGYRSFQSQFAAARSITFHSAHVVSSSGHTATVAVSTTSVRTGGTQRCSGTVDLSSSASRQWRLEQIHITCV